MFLNSPRKHVGIQAPRRIQLNTNNSYNFGVWWQNKLCQLVNSLLNIICTTQKYKNTSWSTQFAIPFLNYNCHPLATLDVSKCRDGRVCFRRVKTRTNIMSIHRLSPVRVTPIHFWQNIRSESTNHVWSVCSVLINSCLFHRKVLWFKPRHFLHR